VSIPPKRQLRAAKLDEVLQDAMEDPGLEGKRSIACDVTFNRAMRLLAKAVETGSPKRADFAAVLEELEHMTIAGIRALKNTVESEPDDKLLATMWELCQLAMRDVVSREQ